MGQALFEPLFHLDLPHGRCVGVALPGNGDADGPLPPSVRAVLAAEETRHVDTLPASRRASWAGGRIALRAALADLSLALDVALEVGPILGTPRGAPLLPEGVRGSISHKEGLAVALAADAAAGDWQLGVDLERVVAGRIDIAQRVLRPEERARLPPPDDPDRVEELVFLFSAKEAIYKALDPFVARYVSFQEVAVERRSDGSAAVELFLRAPDEASDEAPDGAQFDVDVRWLRREDFIITTARARRRSTIVRNPGRVPRPPLHAT
jgi:enterobactin synthetase component D